MGVWDILFPRFCVGCNKYGAYFCKRCVSSILQADLVCPTCEKLSVGGKTHPLCQGKFALDGLWSLGVYKGNLQKGIQKLKYKFVSDLGKTLIDLLVIYWAQHSPLILEELKQQGRENWVVVPVPLHPKRERWRGFNQSALLAKVLAKKLGLKYSESLKRTRDTKPQVGLEGWRRHQNIKDAFSLTTNTSPVTRNVLLIDDVWTTGSTLKECCRVLKKGGAHKVWAITLAR